MKNFKKLIAAATIVGILGVVGVAGASYATGASTPADIAAGLTGKSVEEIRAQRAEGTTCGTIAKEAGKLDEFKTEMLVQKKAVLDQRVKDGKLTQEQADAIYKSLEANQATCDGTGSARIGQKNGAGFGQGMGKGAGQRNGSGFGGGMGMGRS
jgi:Protein of unknown function (DUF2680).